MYFMEVRLNLKRTIIFLVLTSADNVPQHARKEKANFWQEMAGKFNLQFLYNIESLIWTILIID